MGRKSGENGKISIVFLSEGFIPESRKITFQGYAFRTKTSLIILSRGRKFSDKETLDIARKFRKIYKEENDIEAPLDIKGVNKEIKSALRAA